MQYNSIVIELDGQWYEVDVTFDDGITQGNNIARDFFCLTTAEMSSTMTKGGTSSYHQRTGLGDPTTNSLMQVCPVANGTKY